uniref:Transmembrane protein n=1 Tax=Ascaris lumbricoides TaxID=6252 RepID=A0A0M3IGL0_ASCLU
MSVWPNGHQGTSAVTSRRNTMAASGTTKFNKGTPEKNLRHVSINFSKNKVPLCLYCILLIASIASEAPHEGRSSTIPFQRHFTFAFTLLVTLTIATLLFIIGATLVNSQVESLFFWLYGITVLVKEAFNCSKQDHSKKIFGDFQLLCFRSASHKIADLQHLQISNSNTVSRICVHLPYLHKEIFGDFQLLCFRSASHKIADLQHLQISNSNTVSRICVKLLIFMLRLADDRNHLTFGGIMVASRQNVTLVSCKQYFITYLIMSYLKVKLLIFMLRLADDRNHLTFGGIMVASRQNVTLVSWYLSKILDGFKALAAVMSRILLLFSL